MSQPRFVRKQRIPWFVAGDWDGCFALFFSGFPDLLLIAGLAFYLSGGRYVISDVELFMPGKWELRTALGLHAPAAGQDSATPAFQIP